MNFNFYICGTPNGQYSQYPNDYTSVTFAKLQNKVTGVRLVIYREGDLFHYAYAEKIGANLFFGFCLIFNKSQVLRPKNLINLFRQIVERDLISQEKLISYNIKGEITYLVSSLSEEQHYYEKLKEQVEHELSNNKELYGIAPVSSIYNGTKTSVNISTSESDNSIVALTKEHNKVIIDDDKGIENSHIEQIMSSLRSNISNSNNTINKLQQEIKKLKQQKNQYKKVVSLGIFAVLLVVGVFFLYQALNGTQEKLSNTEAELEEKWQKLIEVRNEKDSINSLLSNTQYELAREKKKQLAITNNIQSRYPVIISSTSFDFSKGRLSINYSQAKDTTQYIKIFATRESDGKRVGTSAGNLQFYEEGGLITATFGSHNFSSSQWYSFEIWVNNKLVGGGRH